MSSSLSYQARAFRAIFEKAKDTLDTDKFDCYAQCMNLIQHANLPRLLRCRTYHLLVFCAPPAEALYWVNQASEVIDDMEAIQPDDATIFLRRKNGDIRAIVEAHQAANKAREAAEEEEEEEGQHNEEDEEGWASEQDTSSEQAAGEQADLEKIMSEMDLDKPEGQETEKKDPHLPTPPQSSL